MGLDLQLPPALRDDASLFLDLDGTIVELAPEPEGIEVDDDLRHLLRELEARLNGRVAIVTGRSLANLDAHIRLPGLAAAGSHGLERRPADGRSPVLSPSPQVAAATAAVTSFAAPRGLIVERKPGGVAVHYRQQPDAELAVTEEVESLGREHGLELQKGAMVRELRLPGPNKGDALIQFMSEAPFEGSVPIAIGDDLTDEHSFAAAEKLGGYGILVGARRQSRARYALSSVQALRHWLGEGR